MTAKEFAEKYVGKIVKCVGDYFIVVGYSVNHGSVATKPIKKALYDIGSKVEHHPDTILLRPVEKFWLSQVNGLAFPTAKEFVKLFKGSKVKVHWPGWEGRVAEVIEATLDGYVKLNSGIKNGLFTPSILELLDDTAPTIDMSKYPHKCPRCSNPAYIGFSVIDCSSNCK
jgi:hypothetical protein